MSKNGNNAIVGTIQFFGAIAVILLLITQLIIHQAPPYFMVFLLFVFLLYLVTFVRSYRNDIWRAE